MSIAKKNFTLTMVLLAGVVIGISLWNTAPNRATKNETASPKLAAGGLPNLNVHNKLKGVARKAASAEWFISQRAYGLGYIPPDAEIRAVEDMRTRMIPELAAKGWGQKGLGLQKSAAGQLNWEYHGPGNIGGRLRGLVVHPDNPNIIYVGSVSGGVWKSTNGGASWFSTMNDLITLNISALEMKPGDPNTLYAGTGEGFFFLDNLPGRGILKTTDGGNTWKRVHVDQGLNSPFITAIAVSPANPNVVYAAGRLAYLRADSWPAETVPDPGINAIFKSTDSGETWQDITTGKGIEHNPQDVRDNFPADVVVSPTDANEVYATFGLYYWGGIWKSTNGGQTWSRLTNGLPDPSLPNMGYGRIKLAMAPSNPDVLYASFTYEPKSGDTVNLKREAMLGLWKTTNSGQSWTQVTTPLTINQHNINKGHTTALGSQGGYANAIIVHPTDPDIVFVGGLDIYRSTDGGNTWSQMSMWLEPGNLENPENLPYVHADHHVFAFDLSTNPPTLYNGSDGGIARSRDLGTTWGVLNQDLGVTQFYTFAVHPNNPNIMLGGTQDNGTPMLRSSQVNLWREVAGSDGWQTFFDYTDPNRIYLSTQQLTIARVVMDYATGRFLEDKLIGYTDGSNGITQRDFDKAGFFVPYELSPNNSNVLVLGTNRLLQSTDRGDSWTPISAEFDTSFINVAIAEGNDDIIWAATMRQIYKTEDNGLTYTNVTGANLPKRFITDIEFDPSNNRQVYVTYSGYGTAHVFKSTDAGGSWADITNNLPDIPANTIQVHPQNPNLLFLGTDIGVFLSENGGQTWQPCTNGFPTVQVSAIVLNTNVNRVYAATHGRGVYSAEIASGGTAALNIDVAEVSLQLQPGQTRSAAFTISNGGDANLDYSITATGPQAASSLTNGPSTTTAHLSGLVNTGPHGLPSLDLTTMPSKRGETPVLHAHTAPAQAPTSTLHAAAGTDVLFLDDGDNTADVFFGVVPDSTIIFNNWANNFSLPGFGFRLEAIEFYMRTESASSNIFYFAVSDANGQTLAQGALDLPTSPTGGWYRIPLTTPLTFNAGSSFIILIGTSNAIRHPIGTDFDASVPNSSFYLDLAQQKLLNLNTSPGFQNGAFLIRANGTKVDAASRLSVNPASGTISPGGSQTIIVTFDAKGLAEGDYQGQLSITSNGGSRTVPVRIHVSTSVNVAELAYDNGMPTAGYYWSHAGEGSAVRFTPPSTPAQLKQAKIFIKSIADGNQFNLRVLADANGAPGNTIYGPLPVTVPDTGWVAYDLSAANISVNGDFYIMIEYNGSSEPTFGSEDTPPLEKRSWDFDGSKWSLFDSEDYLIRAVVEYTTGVADRDDDAGLPQAFELAQNYPNPFWSEATSRSAGNPETTIKYQLPNRAQVELAIYDLGGRRVATPESGLRTAGEHTVRWNGRDSAGKRVASGVYFYRLEATSPAGTVTVLTKKMTVMK